jgi:proprotein convertase subtilisin/kexin type 5
LYNNTCVTICPQGTFSTVSVSSSTSRTFSLATNVCDNCSSLCLTCNGSSAYDCLSCNNNYYLYNSTCLLVCPQGFFASIIDQTCKKCMFGCAVCTNFSQCQQCNTNFTLSSTSVCINTIVCSVSQCQICSTNNSCAQCILPYNLYFNSSGNSSCVLTCPLMTYQNNQFTCVPCSSNCISCTNVNCLTCSSNYYLYQGNCVSQCPIGFQAQNSSKKCLPSPCLYSNSNGSCVQCVSPYLL